MRMKTNKLRMFKKKDDNSGFLIALLRPELPFQSPTKGEKNKPLFV